jgi:hypothetical protein
MTWKPESSETHEMFNLTSTISSSLNSAGSSMRSKFKASSGQTYGDLEFPETAPLIFPALDNLANQTGDEALRKRDKLKKAKNFVENYMDKRAQAKYVSHPAVTTRRSLVLLASYHC